LAFIVNYSLVYSLFFVNQVIVVIQDLLSKNIGFYNVFLLVSYGNTVYIGLAFPFASLLSSILATGRLSTDNEIVSFRSSGISLKTIYFYVFIFNTPIAILSYLAHDFLIPYGTQKYLDLNYELSYSSPELIFEPYSIKEYEGRIIVIGDIEGSKIKDMVIFDTSQRGQNRIIMSNYVTLLKNSNSGVISMELNNVYSLATNNFKEYNYLNASKMVYNIILDELNTGVINGANTKNTRELYSNIQEFKVDILENKKKEQKNKSFKELELIEKYREVLKKSNKENFSDELNKYTKEIESYSKNYKNRRVQNYSFEFWQKFAWPSMCLIFPLIGFSTGLFNKRSGKSVGLGVGGALSALYYFLVYYGKDFALSHLEINAGFIIWLPNILFLLLGMFMFRSKLKT